MSTSDFSVRIIGKINFKKSFVSDAVKKSITAVV